MAASKFGGLSDEDAKIFTYKNLVPAFQQSISDLNNQILALQREMKFKETQVAEMTGFLLDHNEVPKTIAEWARDVNGSVVDRIDEVLTDVDSF